MKYITREVELPVSGFEVALEIEFEVSWADTVSIRPINAYNRDTNELVALKDIDAAALAEYIERLSYSVWDDEGYIYKSTGEDYDYR